MVVYIKVTAFWDIALCSLVEIDKRFSTFETSLLRIHSGVNRKLRVNNEDTERVERFTYLGSEVTADGALEDDKTRIKKANGTFVQLLSIAEK
jgi:hypothetical protein